MSGITNIIEIIDSKTEEKIEDILRQAEIQKKQMLDDAKKKAKTVSESILSKAQTASHAELSRQEASAKLKAKYQFLEAKEGVMLEILAEARATMEKQVKNKDYGEVLTNLAVAGGVALNEDNFEIVLPKGHEKEITSAQVSKAISDELGRKVSVTISKETVRAMGGLIIRNEEGTKFVDNTFENRLEQFENRIRDGITSILFKVEED